MAITKMCSYDLKGTKLSFADWISNITPTETPFVSMTGKEGINQTKFQWQSDVIPTAKADNAMLEGSMPSFEDEITSTLVTTNVTQIFRRAVSVSDTASSVAYYGRGKEVGYQMEKAGAELKRDMEKAFLFQDHKTGGSSAEVGGDMGTDAASGTGAHTAGFLGLVAGKDKADKDTGAVVHKELTSANIKESDIFDMTYQLYLANSKANVIMFHPKNAGLFSGMLSVAGAVPNRMKMFGAMEDTYNTEVDTLVDPLGQKFALVPNRHMPEKYFYFFNPSDWTQMVLRAPKKIQLAKVGSSEQWMIEAEIGLRHRNAFASGILKDKA